MAKKLWGARFKSELHPNARDFSYSLGVDHELLTAEIQVSLAHALMLGKVGIVSQRESRALVAGLRKVNQSLRRKSVCDVIKQGGELRHRCQFSWWCDGKSDRIRSKKTYKKMIQYAKMILSLRYGDPSVGALFKVRGGAAYQSR